MNPKLSAYAQLNRAFNYNTTPLAPPGCKAVAYESEAQHASWNTKGVDTWYLGAAMDHISVTGSTYRQQDQNKW